MLLISRIYEGAGLPNLGNTCFMNCAMQVFLHIGPLVQWFQENEVDRLAAPVAYEWMCLLERSRTITSETSPNAFVNAFRRKVTQFIPYQQDDTVEFIIKFLEAINTELHPARPFDAVFEFCKLVSVKCEECKYTSKSEIWGSMIMLQLNGLAGNLANIFYEHLEDKSKRKCYECNKDPNVEQPCVQRIKFKHAPMFLQIQLLRFSQDQPKIESEITIPQFINVYVSDESTIPYKIFAIINHIQYDGNNGHYTTIIKGPGGSWIEYNDSIVRNFDFLQLDKSQPYMVIYERMRDNFDEVTYI